MQKKWGVVALSTIFSALFLIAGVAPAGAAPKKPTFGPMIEGYGGYEGQTRCSPSPKPGVLAFQRLIMNAYPDTGWGGISRACNIGGQSEHKEGRAWDWMAPYTDANQRARALDVLDWLAAPDRFGNDAAMARRVGIMYAIYHRKIWFPGSGWRVYCVDHHGVCKSPEDHGVRDPHISHVHFSFTWAGARKETSFWHPATSMVTAVSQTPSGSGLWSIGANGGVLTAGETGYFGSKAGERLASPIVAAAPSASGYGYWMVTKKGKVFNFGDARRYGSMQHNTRIADIASSPLGTGYWLLSQSGHISAFGKVRSHGSAENLDAKAVAIGSTPTGKGYWILTSTGRVLNFGDAAALADAGGQVDDAVDMAVTSTGLGYLMTTSDGQVKSFGDAVKVGSKPRAGATYVGIARDATGLGYWLVTKDGKVQGFGDAGSLSLRRPTIASGIAALFAPAD